MYTMYDINSENQEEQDPRRIVKAILLPGLEVTKSYLPIWVFCTHPQRIILCFFLPMGYCPQEARAVAPAGRGTTETPATGFPMPGP